MVVSHDELDRLADDIYKNRRITGWMYCGHCGYNLRTLPYVYTCPECGHEYNARPLSMRGIFLPQQATFPLRDLAALLACVLGTAVFAYGSVQPARFVHLGIASLFAGLSLWFAAHTYKRLAAFLKAVNISRRIAAEERNL